jgi:hypothetical protein
MIGGGGTQAHAARVTTMEMQRTDIRPAFWYERNTRDMRVPLIWRDPPGDRVAAGDLALPHSPAVRLS